MKFTPRALALAATICLVGTVRADVTLPTLFGEHAVLQRDMPVPIWGTASPGETVTVSFNGQDHPTTADAARVWTLLLDAMAANPSPGPLTVTGNNTIRLLSLRIGEVWLGSGQSIMFRAISQDAKRDVAVTEAAALDLSLFNVAAGSPDGAVWQDSDAGGSGGLYRDQIVPLQPYTIRAVLWYEGEWDTRNDKDAEKDYWQLPALINEWRSDWGQGEFPFYVVQLPRMGLGQVHVVRDAELRSSGRRSIWTTSS